jgi:hypothetical protein
MTATGSQKGPRRRSPKWLHFMRNRRPRGQGEPRVSVARDSPSCSPCSRDVDVKSAWWWVSGKVSSVQILPSIICQDSFSSFEATDKIDGHRFTVTSLPTFQSSNGWKFDPPPRLAAMRPNQSESYGRSAYSLSGLEELVQCW